MSSFAARDSYPVIRTADGAAVRCTQFDPPARARATVVVYPGIGVPRRAMRAFGAWLAASGLRAITVDYRGMDDRDDPDGATLTTWATLDAPAVFRYAESLGAPVLVVGHSFGGQLLGLADDFARACAVVLVAAQFGYWRNWSGVDRLKVGALWRVIYPLATRIWPRRVPGWTAIGVPLPASVAREWALWGRHPDYVLAYDPDARRRYASLAMPARAYSFADDAIAPPRAVAHLLSALTGTEVDHRAVAPADLGVARIGHFGFFRREVAETLWEEVLAFFEGALAAPAHGLGAARRARAGGVRPAAPPGGARRPP